MTPLLDWVKERESIRQKKEAGLPPPWTDDPIFRQYRFTNVRRRHDRVSRWLLENVLLEKHIEQDLSSFLLFSALCRWINWPPTIKALMVAGYYPAKRLDFRGIGALIDKRTKHEKTWTGAYMVRAKPGSNKGKGHFVAYEVIKRSLGKALPNIELALLSQHRSEVWSALFDCLNWGSFMAGQVVADWGYTSLLKGAQDTYTWAPQGPGSLRGFNRLLGLPLKTRHKPEEWCAQLGAWRSDIVHILGPEYADLELMDVQNCLCELDKWLRVKNGEGRPRATYRPETAF